MCTKYGTMRATDDYQELIGIDNVNEDVLTELNRKMKEKATKAGFKIQNLIHRITIKNEEEDEETIALWTESTEDNVSSFSSKNGCKLDTVGNRRTKHRGMRRFLKGVAEAVMRQFYFMTVSIEHSGGVYRATTVTMPDGTVTTELRYYPSSPYAMTTSSNSSHIY